MYADPLPETRALAASMQAELRTTIPSFVKRPDTELGLIMQNYIKETRLDKIGSGFKAEPDAEDVVLVDYERDAEERVVAAALYPFTHSSMATLIQDSRRMTQDQRNKIISSYCGNRINRRHKPGRGFESARYTFDICANFGCYRDIHRHRMLTQQRQQLGCLHGYTLPKEIVDSGHEGEFRNAMEAAKNAWGAMAKTYPHEAQYAVPLAYRIRWQMALSLREAFQFCELRSARQGHIDYRRVAQGMYGEIKRVHPSLARHMKFVDMNDYEFERLEAEKQLDKRIMEMGRK
jgi:thymidylate synthase ThyX